MALARRSLPALLAALAMLLLGGPPHRQLRGFPWEELRVIARGTSAAPNPTG